MGLTSLTDSAAPLAPDLQAALLNLARESIGFGLQHARPLATAPDAFPPVLREFRASFVTLKKAGALRGCIGSLEAYRPLAIDVAENAFAAAFRDPRFPPVGAHELDALELQLSLLTPAEPMTVRSEDDLLDQLRPGEDGLILQEGGRRATFLPSVWESLPEPDQFLRHLKRKAGLPEDYWSDALQVFRYATEHIP
ncbi:MAG: AmmeMemoRadiSam system protein A [Gammaproteobacteria bacterium]|nr:AmmeMemoRadiSam system protein A [Gammaproteobacteria bacterium]